MFNALKAGTIKNERILINELRRYYKIPKYKKVSKYLVANVQDSEVFVKIINYFLPFSQMLRDIYQFLDEHKSSLFGNTDQFAFNFKTLSQRVPFGLDSFPKTYLNVTSSKVIEGFLFNPDSTGRLLVDFPNYWNTANALQNLGNHHLPDLLTGLLKGYGCDESDEFINEYKEIIHKIVERARTVIKCCQNLLIYDQEDFHGGPGPGYFYYRSKEDLALWKKAIKNIEKRNRFDPKKLDDFYEVRSKLKNEFRRFDLSWLHKLVDAWEEYPSHIKNKDKSKYKPTVPDVKDFDRYVDAFQLAYNLVVTKIEEIMQVLDEFIDKVILPFWSYRPRLYEIWALIMTMRQFPEKAQLKLSVDKREDTTDAYEWKIEKDKTPMAVGVFELHGRSLEVWFERTTKNLRGDRYITPDIRIMKPNGEDIFILELKDRYKFSIEVATEVLKKYSTGSSAKSVALVNYSPFDANFLKGDRMVLNEDGKILYIVNEFKPGNLDHELICTIKELTRQYFEFYDLILDVSGSIAGIDINSQIKYITERRGPPNQIFSFSNKLNPVNFDSNSNYDLTISGNTDVKNILEEYMYVKLGSGNYPSEIIIMTDEEGMEQFKQYTLTENFFNIGFSIFRYGKNVDPVDVTRTLISDT